LIIFPLSASGLAWTTTVGLCKSTPEQYWAAGMDFAWNLDGEAEGTGWVGKDDGFPIY
jgi:hypothetical protein